MFGAIIRAAYELSTKDQGFMKAHDQGYLFTIHTVDLKLPMVAPDNIGRVAARFLTSIGEAQDI